MIKCFRTDIKNEVLRRLNKSSIAMVDCVDYPAKTLCLCFVCASCLTCRFGLSKHVTNGSYALKRHEMMKYCNLVNVFFSNRIEIIN